ncbi:hypothetical protein D3C85_1883540 [compost metagenome]
MHVDEGAQFGGRVLGQFVPQRLQLAVHGGQRLLQAQHLGLQMLFRHQVMLDVQRRRRQHVRAANGDAA